MHIADPLSRRSDHYVSSANDNKDQVLLDPVSIKIVEVSDHTYDECQSLITREFQGSTPRCPGPNPRNTHTHTPKGAGHSHGCRGADPSWVYPGVGPSHSQVHREQYIITIYYTP